MNLMSFFLMSGNKILIETQRTALNVLHYAVYTLHIYQWNASNRFPIYFACVSTNWHREINGNTCEKEQKYESVILISLVRIAKISGRSKLLWLNQLKFIIVETLDANIHAYGINSAVDSSDITEDIDTHLKQNSRVIGESVVHCTIYKRYNTHTHIHTLLFGMVFSRKKKFNTVERN